MSFFFTIFQCHFFKEKSYGATPSMPQLIQQLDNLPIPMFQLVHQKKAGHESQAPRKIFCQQKHQSLGRLLNEMNAKQKAWNIYKQVCTETYYLFFLPISLFNFLPISVNSASYIYQKIISLMIHTMQPLAVMLIFLIKLSVRPSVCLTVLK